MARPKSKVVPEKFELRAEKKKWSTRMNKKFPNTMCNCALVFIFEYDEIVSSNF